VYIKNYYLNRADLYFVPGASVQRMNYNWRRITGFVSTIPQGIGNEYLITFPTTVNPESGLWIHQ
jgi:hypothetical protein